MTDEQRFERAARSWLELGPTQAPDRVLRAAFDDIERTGQERPLIPTWVPVPAARPLRTRDRAAILAVAAAAAVLVVYIVIAAIAGSRPPNPVAPSLAPVPPPSPVAVGEPDASAIAWAQGLTQRFTSDRYGYSIAVRPGWTTTKATLTWTGPDNTGPVMAFIDIPDVNAGMGMALEPLLPGQTLEEWLRTFQPPTNTGGCNGGPPETWPAIQIGGEPGQWQLMCDGNGEAVVAHGARAFTWGQGDASSAEALSFDRFQEVLRSVQFLSTPLATQDPPPPLARTFTSARNGFSIGYPAGWTTKAATTSAPSTFVPPDDDPGLDVLGDDALRLTIISVPLETGVSADDWAHTFCAFARTKWSPPCAD